MEPDIVATVRIFAAWITQADDQFHLTRPTHHTATISRWLSSQRGIDVDSPAGGVIQVRSFWFPGWVATIDGLPLTLKPSDPYGMITFEVPPGPHRVDLLFGATPVRLAATAAMIVSILITTIVFFRSRWLPEDRA